MFFLQGNISAAHTQAAQNIFISFHMSAEMYEPMLRHCLCMVLLFAAGHCSHDDIVLEDGGYGNILISVDEHVDYHPNILPNLQVSNINILTVLLLRIGKLFPDAQSTEGNRFFMVFCARGNILFT